MSLIWWLNSHMNNQLWLLYVTKEKWSWHDIHDFKVHHIIHCGRKLFWVVDGTIGNDFEIEEEADFSIMLLLVISCTSTS